MPLTVPVQLEVARETLTPLFPKNWASTDSTPATVASLLSLQQTRHAVPRSPCSGHSFSLEMSFPDLYMADSLSPIRS